jgi:hypothetical protein
MNLSDPNTCSWDTNNFPKSDCATEKPLCTFVTSLRSLRKFSSVSLSEKTPLGGKKHTWKHIINIVLCKEWKSVKRIYMGLNADQRQGHLAR